MENEWWSKSHKVRVLSLPFMEKKESDIILDRLCDIRDNLLSANYYNANLIWDLIKSKGWEKKIISGRLAAHKGSTEVSIYHESH